MKNKLINTTLLAILFILFFSVNLIRFQTVNASPYDDRFIGTDLNLNYNELDTATKILGYNDSSPKITVLNHGYLGSESNWSNDGITGSFAYNANSLIELLRYNAGNTVEVYLAETYEIIEPYFNLVKLVVSGEQYIRANVTTLTSVPNQIIIVFVSKDKNYESNDDSLKIL